MTGLKKMTTTSLKKNIKEDKQQSSISEKNFKQLLLDEFGKNGKTLLSPYMQQHQAFNSIKDKGFPKQKEEVWRFTPLSELLNREYSLALLDQSIVLKNKDLEPYLVPDLDSYLAVFIDGVFKEDLSNLKDVNFIVEPLSLAKRTQKTNVSEYYGAILEQDKEERFEAINTLLVKDGLYVEVPKKIEASKSLQVLYLYTDQKSATFNQVRNLFLVAAQSKLEIIERHQTLSQKNHNWINAVSEVFVDKAAHFSYFKVQNDTFLGSLSDATYIKQDKDSVVNSFTFSFGGSWTRNNLGFYHENINVETNLRGLTLIDEKQFVDHHTKVDHAKPNCQSNQVYKGIYAGNASGVFNGRINVAVDAQKINAFQQSNNLLLSDQARINTKPQLEIFADDVRCSHGCTIGQLDEDALFYLRSRGLPEQKARNLLTFAFCSDVLDAIKLEPLKNQIRSWMLEKLV